jgi:hypothetical protein
VPQISAASDTPAEVKECAITHHRSGKSAADFGEYDCKAIETYSLYVD